MPQMTAVVQCLLNLALIAALPRVFFRSGRLNLRWWATAAPFVVAGGALAAGAAGVLTPGWDAAGWAPLLSPLASAFSLTSVGIIGFTLGTHREPLSLWHQDDDAPRRLVTHGAYARVRHPFYLSFLVGLGGCVVAFPHPLTLTALLYSAVLLNVTAVREERRLLASPFGREYAGYIRRTGRLAPRLLRRNHAPGAEPCRNR